MTSISKNFSNGPLNVVFRVDSSRIIGSGHVSRCLTLATQLRDHGASIVFLLRNLEGNCNSLVDRAGFSKVILGDIDKVEITPSLDDRHWLSVPAAQDVEETRQAITRTIQAGVDWLVVDHYGIDSVWLKKSREFAKHLLVIDDLANRPLDCDILVNVPYDDSMRALYDKYLPPTCCRLLGPQYALLRKEFLTVKYEPQRKVLIYLGGGDNQETLCRIADSLEKTDLFSHGYDVECILGVGDASTKVSSYLEDRKITIRGHIDSMPQYLSTIALCIGAGGISLWERLALGVPSITMSIAANQERILTSLGGQKAICHLGRASEFSKEDLQSAINNFCGGRLGLVGLKIAIQQDYLWPLLIS